ncbi:MAG: GDSL-type esterase/lipase family protein [Thermoguttaceae bacterium]
MRNTFSILLVALLANVLCANNVFAADALSPDFERAVRNYEMRSIDDPPVPGNTLFVGSSSFALWGKKLEEAFADRDAVNRGFGGSIFADNILALQRIHIPYRPSRVVIFCGTNDFARGQSVDEVYRNFTYYIARHWVANPLAEIFFVSTTHAPAREKFWENGDELCRRVRELATKTSGLYFIDIITPMNDESGRVREELFVADRLHLNDAGHAIWTDAFRAAFAAADAQTTQRDVRKLFAERKSLGLFDDPRFVTDSITVTEPSASDTKLHVIFIGDSITSKIDWSEVPSPDACAKYLASQAGVGEVTFANVGVSGATTADFLPKDGRLFGRVRSAIDEAKREHGESEIVFSLMLGTNDSAVTGPNGAPRTPSQYRDNLRLIIDELLTLAPNAKVGVHRPIWYSETTQNSSTYLLEGQLRAAAYAEEIRRLVAAYTNGATSGRVFLGDFNAFDHFRTHSESLFAPEKSLSGATFYLHPNTRGADILGRFWGEAIRGNVL